ncbi:MAG: chromosomal replication initiator protein DnaA [Acidimicrobiaceae bacterium]|nr:chromosomal replication initiator protein DnaA [Acidimicrobiaceae bacterium]MXW77236.1 chromosomal replication initiator protein DnaA [Acidimicrobiaceae bacterium]MYA73099.1 chromosomal replication initiator protein DnaA [Acidimicrobiaceae bacterium]MYC42114.1 chromosomal replication initiator protein DnaA [Acidimicrobiaceae bacterium]MYD06813.1 chromosomal replication initiator protein DnaA [Acidimicrobiaceae bacterium]
MDKPVESQLNNNEANDADGLWSSCAESIRAQVSDAVWHTTFSGARAAAFDGGELVIVVPNGLQKERIEGRYLGLVKHAITESRSNATVRVEIDTDWTEAAFDIPSADLTAPPEHIPMSEPISEPLPEALPEARNELNEKFTFEHFVIGPSNRFAHAAAFSVAETPAASYNPLFIHGDSGLGKTHLLRGIAHYIGSHYSHYKVRYVSTETFLNEFVQAIRTNTQPEFKRRYRTNDVLLIDDIQFMEGKEGLQEEFFHTFNELHQNNKQIVLSSDRTPDAMPTLEERLRNRFKWGLITDIQRPDLETRLAILRKKAESRTIQIPGDVFTFIAENITQSIRELEGALIKVTAYASLTEQPLDMRLASYVLTDLINNSQKPPVTATRIIELTGEMFGFEVDQITGGSRRRPLVDARQVAMYVARNMTDLSFPDIGRAFGDRDHTTVMHAVRKIEARMGERQQIFDKVTELQRRLNEPP